jgi:hypothetical protein
METMYISTEEDPIKKYAQTTPSEDGVASF